MAEEVSAPSLFNLGQLFITSNAQEQISETDVFRALDRHAAGDWGEVGLEDWQLNDQALIEGSRLLSVYWSMSRKRFWIITEADRSSSTVLMPEDY